MMTDNENWRNGSDENQDSANGYNRAYNRENRFNSYNNYNREEGSQRPFRPSGYGNRMNGGMGNRTERTQRPRFTRSSENAGGESRPRFHRKHCIFNEKSAAYSSLRVMLTSRHCRMISNRLSVMLNGFWHSSPWISYPAPDG